MNNTIAKQIARWVALGALFLIPLTPLVVASTYFFPFITGKAFFFRILVEIAACAWLVLALLDKEYRPRFSYIGVATIAFVTWMFIADMYAINVAKAFWSNFERMEGWVLLAHLTGLFFAASGVLRTEKKWRAWFLWSLIVSLFISGYSLLQLSGSLQIHQGSTRIDATFGNSAYLAIYFLFNTFIALWLALTEKYSWLKWSLIMLAVVEAGLIFFTETRGTIIGLTLGLTLAAILTLVTAGKRARAYATIALVLITLFVGGFYLVRDSAFVQNNHILQRIATISLSDGQTRFTLWQMALSGVAERPMVGWGQEGFSYVFNKYYNPSLFAQESWFDRAHNTFVDWLIAGGIPAFLFYLTLFGSALVLLWKSSELSRPERIALTAALVGYAVHNIFVFDNLYSYIYFFAILALIDSQVARPIESVERAPVIGAEEGVIYALPIATVLTVTLIYTVNVPGMTVASSLITALSPSPMGIEKNIATFRALEENPSFAKQEVREQLVSFAGVVAQSQSVSNDVKAQAVSLALTGMKKQVEAYPLDARGRLQLANAYRLVGENTLALQEIKMAQTLSPQKEQILIDQGTMQWNQGDVVSARDSFAKAYSLGKQFSDLAAYAAAGNIAVGDIPSADAILLEAYQTTVVNSDILAVAYYHTKNWPRLIALWKLRTNLPNATAETWFGLASAYYVSGDTPKSITIINETVQRFPNSATTAKAAITEIQARLAK